MKVDKHLAFLSIPGLRRRDLAMMPCLTQLGSATCATLQGSFPCVTWPAQASLLTGKPPQGHGVVANGFYWREEDRVEMWTAWNEKIQAPQIWDRLPAVQPDLTSAVWFPMLSKGCGADYVCMPAPVHNPDGSESLWCYTKPQELYGELRDALGHFPLKHFWGPLAGIPSTQWIVDSAIVAAERYRPNFFYLYLPHLDYAAQKYGPDSPQAEQALAELDAVIGKLADGLKAAYKNRLHWMAVSEYTVQTVDHVSYPNRILRDAGLLAVKNDQGEDGELLDTQASQAWCLVDHQFSHVFVKDSDPSIVAKVGELFRVREGIAEVLTKEDQSSWGMEHARSGDLMLVSTPNSWQAYYWWLDDAGAPAFARTVDIHRKPGYDPVELCFDPVSRSIPLDATLIRGSHGLCVPPDKNEAVLISSDASIVPGNVIRDLDVAEGILAWFAQ